MMYFQTLTGRRQSNSLRRPSPSLMQWKRKFSSHESEQTSPLSLYRTAINLRNAPFQYGPVGKTHHNGPRHLSWKTLHQRMRVMVPVVLDTLAEGLSPEEITEEYPALTIADMRASLA